MFHFAPRFFQNSTIPALLKAAYVSQKSKKNQQPVWVLVFSLYNAKLLMHFFAE